MKRIKYQPTGLLALQPEAFGGMFDIDDVDSEVCIKDGVAIIDICGPLMNHRGFFFDSYEAIQARVEAAVSKGPTAIVMRIDSPGGLVAGCFEAARAIRAMCEEASIPLVSFVDGCAASAAYALACSAKHIVAGDTSLVGSVGVIDALVDMSSFDAAMGMKWKLVTSGARKADGNPHQPISNEAIAAMQSRVDEIAKIFHTHVAEARGIPVASVQSLEAGIFVGASAKQRGLVDEVGTMENLFAAIHGGNVPHTQKETDMGTKAAKMAAGDDEKMSKLRKMAEDGDKEAARILEALDDTGKEEPEPAPENENDTPPPADEKTNARATAKPRAAISAGTAGDLARGFATLAEEVATLRAENEDGKKDKLFSSRSDLDASLVALLKTKPLAECEAIIGAIPRKAPSKPAALAQPASTIAGPIEPMRLAPAEKAKLDARMGLLPVEATVKNTSHKLVLGAYEPAKS